MFPLQRVFFVLCVFVVSFDVSKACHGTVPVSGSVCQSSTSQWYYNGTLETQDVVLLGSSTLTVSGNLILLPASTVEMTLQNFTTAANASVLLSVSGVAQVSGTLNLTLLARPPGSNVTVLLASEGVVESFQVVNIVQQSYGNGSSKCDTVTVTQTSVTGNDLTLQFGIQSACPHHENPAPLYIVIGLCATVLLVAFALCLGEQWYKNRNT